MIRQSTLVRYSLAVPTLVLFCSLPVHAQSQTATPPDKSDPPPLAIPESRYMQEQLRTELLQTRKEAKQALSDLNKKLKRVQHARAEFDKAKTPADVAKPAADVRDAVDAVIKQITDAKSDEAKLRSIDLSRLESAIGSLSAAMDTSALHSVEFELSEDDISADPFPRLTTAELPDFRLLRSIKTQIALNPTAQLERLQSVKSSLADAAALTRQYQADAKKVQEWLMATERALQDSVNAAQETLQTADRHLALLSAEMDKRQAAEERPTPVYDRYVFPSAILALILLIPILVWVLKKFELSIQMKMIDSRFLIEILSVALLIVAIIILGTADKLKTEALGTLLGTVAGYVLSRNVAERAGMAASAAVQKSFEAAKGAPPLSTSTSTAT